jgi:hypothetical protein
MLKNSCFWAGACAAISGYLFLLFNEIIFFNFSYTVFLEALLGVPLYFLVAYFFAFCLLIPLKFLIANISTNLSFCLFVVVGFSIPYHILVSSGWILGGFVVKVVELESNHSIYRIVSMSMMGGLSAAASWYCLKINKVHRVT